MSDVRTSPGRLERWFLSLPDGTVLRIAFLAVLAMGASMLAQDVLEVAGHAGDRERLTRTEPLRLPAPKPGDQIRPYLPRAVPVAPNRGEPVLPGYDGAPPADAMARAMSFHLGEDGVASAVGRIDAGTAEAFKRFLGEDGAGVRRIVLHSPGGSVRDAIAMSRLVRERKLETAVPADGYCASACPLVLAGGTRRTAGEAAWVGVHQVYAVSDAASNRLRDLDRSIADIQATIAECQSLLVEMGVDPRLWIHAMQTPADELYVLTPDELGEFKLVGATDADAA
ncbi:ATP-dependent Clp protease proteolytic subunit [Aureimonas sp. SK2]|uniref:ATP-dependent Clp protease proteolytic subunit n=1 Tax=Aureimonas sp. SK2 TaxID=3015992 RepID=UPI00244421FA|nr:ATP-dependent Clp protease proteolytic subunit [Aureimonas sp. SK2]